MKTGNLRGWLVLLWSFVIIPMMIARESDAYPNGLTSTNCQGCHTGSTPAAPSVETGGVTATSFTVAPGGTTQFRVIVNGPNGQSGLNVDNTGGVGSISLSAQGANGYDCAGYANQAPGQDTYLTGGQVTHTQQKLGSTFYFNYTAPNSACKTTTFLIWGNNVNHSCSADGGDHANDTTITVSTECYAQGTACSSAAQCASGFCTDGYCCNSACGNGAADCEACNNPFYYGTCTSTGNQCRAAVGACDVAEYCAAFGTALASGACPADGVAAGGETVQCSAAPGASAPCDLGGYCDGSSKLCPAGPANHKGASTSTQCGTPSGVCNLGQFCNGPANATCNATVIGAPTTTQCVAAAGASNPCDLGAYCEGVGSPICNPTHVGAAATTLCQASTGTCDQGAFCNGPGNDTCNTTHVPVTAASNTTCYTPTGVCDAVTKCNGVSTVCPGASYNVGANCGSAPSLATCSGQATCVLGNKACPAPPAAFGTQVCNAAPAGSTCFLDAACNGATTGCPTNPVKPKNTQCAAPSTGPCDSGEYCDGTTGACTTHQFTTGNQCAAAACDVSGLNAIPATLCNGTSAACPAAGAPQSCMGFTCTAGVCNISCATTANCSSGDICFNSKCVPPTTKGQACSAALAPCATGLSCVDGVCCNGTCSGECEACNLVGTVGTCTAVVGNAPANKTPCMADGSSCSGTCDGITRMTCTYPGQTTQCRTPSCDPSSNTSEPSVVCDGMGHCPAYPAPKQCAPMMCSGAACSTDCLSTSECTSGYYCSSGTCVPTLDNGGTCQLNSDCTNGHCVDGVCCDGTCTGQCEACNLPTSLGMCTPVPMGAPPANKASCMTDGSKCGGQCDGSTGSVCTYPDTTSVCVAASCDTSTSVATPAAFCDGNGNCPPATPQACDPYMCKGTICGGNCAVDTDCPDGQYCPAGKCLNKKAQGSACGGANECATGQCIDGFCCDVACGGQCQACNVPGLPGTCSPVPAGNAPVGTRMACSTDGSVCGGSCDGTNVAGCAYPDGTASCRDASCSNGVATLQENCDGKGSCPAIQTETCAPFSCGATACSGDCKTTVDCPSAYYCSGGKCEGKLDQGKTCGANEQCSGGFCVDGVCCDKACGGQCEACDNSGSLGTCSPVKGLPPKGRPACTGGTGLCAASCDGTNGTTCDYPGASVQCGSTSCTSGIETSAGTCDGGGKCSTMTMKTPCAPYNCGPTTCLESCTKPSDCSPGYSCISDKCTMLGGTGGAAGAAGSAGEAGSSAVGGSGTAGKGGSSTSVGAGGNGGVAGTSSSMMGVGGAKAGNGGASGHAGEGGSGTAGKGVGGNATGGKAGNGGVTGVGGASGGHAGTTSSAGKGGNVQSAGEGGVGGAGGDSAAAPGATTPETEGGACGCRTAPVGDSPALPLIGFAALAFLVKRRRDGRKAALADILTRCLRAA